MKRRIILVLIILGITAPLAYAMRSAIERTIIQPLLYVWWVIGIYYDSFPQAFLWILLMVVIVMIAIGSLFVDAPDGEGRRTLRKPLQGPVESLAGWLQRAPHGIYFKWLLARRLGLLSRDLIAFDNRREARFGQEALRAPGWEPPQEVADYLECGLNGSFADYPRPRWFFQKPRPTPLDLHPDRAVDYVESQMKKS